MSSRGGEFSRSSPDRNLNEAVHLAFSHKALFSLRIHPATTISRCLAIDFPFSNPAT